MELVRRIRSATRDRVAHHHLTMAPMIPYAARRIAPLARLSVDDWELKRYSVSHTGQVFDEARFSGGVALARAVLPQPARTAERPGVGFLVLHQGNGIDYTVLAWWDRENELPLRVFVCERPGSNAWRAARDSESICVWDLQVIWAEREAYVGTVLAVDVADGVTRYLSREWQTDERI